MAVTWLALLPASSASLILCRVVLNQEPPTWLGYANLAALMLLIAVASTVASWRPLRGYFLALLAFAAAGMIADHVAATLVLGRVARMFANTVLQLIPCGLLALTLVGSGLTRRDVFLAKGDMAANARLPWGTTSWRSLGPILTLAFAGGLAVQLTLTLHPDIQMLGRAMVALPLAIAFSVVNAVQEEFRFRAVFLARLMPAVGMTHALAVSSMLFGLEHWYGHPGGPSGVLLSGFAGYMWARSMVETRGSAWAWIIHGLMDVVIFAFLVMANG